MRSHFLYNVHVFSHPHVIPFPCILIFSLSPTNSSTYTLTVGALTIPDRNPTTSPTGSRQLLPTLRAFTPQRVDTTINFKTGVFFLQLTFLALSQAYPFSLLLVLTPLPCSNALSQSSSDNSIGLIWKNLILLRIFKTSFIWVRPRKGFWTSPSKVCKTQKLLFCNFNIEG